MAGKSEKKKKSKTTFTVYGPFKIPVKKGKGGKGIDKYELSEFWNKAGEIADKKGCYVFSVRLSQGAIKPWYVGKTSNSFRNECFTYHKITKYDEVLRDYAACTPVLFLIVSAAPHASNQIKALEKFFIDLGVTVNPKILQTKDVSRPRWTIPGVTESNGRGKVPVAVLKFRKAFGLKPPQKRQAPKKKRARKA